MGLYDRDYLQQGYRSPQGYYRRIFGPPSSAVKWLFAANVAVYILQVIGLDRSLTIWFAVWPKDWKTGLQVWRLISYQFLHGNFLHILFNMIGLLSFGPMLEQSWGTWRFARFYFSCGIAGGLCYMALAMLGILDVGFMIGASGAILGMLAACAILFPHIKVLFYLFIPMPIRYVAILFIAVGLFVIFTGGYNAGGEAAHLGGMAAGAGHVLLRDRIDRLVSRIKAYIWHKQIDKAAELEQEVDRILQKVHDHGIHSLTWREKAILRKATELERRRVGRY